VPDPSGRATIVPPLIGLAHGSRHPRTAADVDELLAAVAGLRPGLTAVPAYLDLTEPDLPTSVTALGASAAVVVPLLFTAAFHVQVDVPAAVRDSGNGTDLLVAEHLGLGEPVLQALVARARTTGIDDDREILLLAVGSSDEAANAAVGELAQRWAARRAGPVRAAFATSAPRASDLLAVPGFSGAVVPLFVASGLLLDATAKRAQPRGVPVAAPLGTLLAPLVLDRYDRAVRAARSSGPAGPRHGQSPETVKKV
jgi:sirohydrochlorin ferrochelatase